MGEWTGLILPGVIVLLFVGLSLEGFELFFKGWGRYRRYVFLRDTPRQHIHGCAMGLVQVRGKAKWTEATASPVYGVASLFSIVDISHVTDTLSRPAASHLTTDNDVRRFWLEDETGRILVDAPNASINFESSPSLVIEAIDKINPFNSPEVDSLEPYINARVKSIEHASMPEPQKRKLLDQVLKLGRYSGGRFVLTEKCIVPGQELSAIGTCVPNPDPHDPVGLMLTTGQNDLSFEVTATDLQAVERNLRWEAIWYVFVGATLSVSTVAVALYLFDLIRRNLS